MQSKEIKKYCVLGGSAFETLKRAVEKFNFSARSYDEILKVSRTIADLDSSDVIKTNHIVEAVTKRNLKEGCLKTKRIKKVYEKVFKGIR
jgi:magnesium chelatase family protein